MILTLFLIEIYLFIVVTSESVNLVYHNTNNVGRKPYKKVDLLSSPIYHTSITKTNKNYNYITNQQQQQKYANVKTKQSFRYYSIATQPISKTSTLKTLPNVNYKPIKIVPTQYLKNTNVGPTIAYKYHVNKNNLRPYQYYYYPRVQYNTKYNYPLTKTQYYYPSTQTQYNYPSTQTQYNYPPSQSQYNYPSTQTQYNYPSTQTQNNYPPSRPSLLPSLDYEYTYPHKGHGFFGNELAQFWIVCHDCPRG
ncbi:Hypothetical protein SRAE_1000234300 [Strongyloides ratti]|uniref:Uncharacterized protein n=1 Tax=Strongyloides ratti TaxID=34506 RepID=A0A090L302_STRRB|nr:Hypothetical protein SRAE_1000234300 [Strongyloides ratti]CEF64087.1 Hypothetical protein SRAE_1000234300 [Strongyloides ratti]